MPARTQEGSSRTPEQPLAPSRGPQPLPLWVTAMIGVVGACFALGCVVCWCLRCFGERRRGKQREITYAPLRGGDLSVEKVQPAVDGLEDPGSRRYGGLLASLHYDFTERRLHVGVERCVQLPLAGGLLHLAGDLLTTDPFVRVHLAPDVLVVHQTHHRASTLDPVFDEHFTFDVPYEEAGSRAVVFEVYDHNRLTVPVKLCQIRISLVGFDFSRASEEWYELEAPLPDEKATDVGQICVSLRFVPAASQLKVVVIEAKDIARTRVTQSEVYVKLSLMLNQRRLAKKKTSRKRDTLNPYFNETFTFSVSAELAQVVSLVVTLAEHDPLGRAVSLGSARLGTRGKATECAHWNNALSNQRHAVAQWHTLHD